MKIWLVVIFSFLSYSCNGSLVNQSTQSSVNAERKGTDITDFKMEVDVMKENYHALLLRVNNNEHTIVTLKGKSQQIKNVIEHTKRTLSCEIEGLRDASIQFKQELNETINSWNTMCDTIQDLTQSVSLLDNKYSPLEIPGKHSDESGDELECPFEWIRRIDFGACYFFSNETMSWDDSQEQCRKQNGSLADIHSENEAVWLADTARNNTANTFWIGGKNDHGVYKWFTSDGKNKDMNYTRWGTNNPLSLSKKNGWLCVEMWDLLQYKWFIYNCTSGSTFICKTYI